MEERLPLPQWVSTHSSACVVLSTPGAPLLLGELGGGPTSKALLGGSWVLYQVGLTKLCGEHYSPERALGAAEPQQHCHLVVTPVTLLSGCSMDCGAQPGPGVLLDGEEMLSM